MSFETSDNLPRYFKTIRKSTPLSLEEETLLAARIKAGDMDATHTLVKHNLKIVATIANRHIGQGLPIDDLIQEGNIGLYEAAVRFDPKNGARFITYAQLWIRKRINEAVVAHGRIVRLPHNQEYDRYKAKKSGEEIANISSLDLDAKLSDDGETTLGDIILNCEPSVYDGMEREAVAATIAKALSLIGDRDRQIIKAYFGLEEGHAIPTDVLAERFDMTNVRISQIVRASINKMKLTLTP